MPLPEKPYHSIQELAGRWHLSLSDLHDYAKYGLLEVVAWVDLGIVNVFRVNQENHSQKFPAANPFRAFQGYAVVPSNQLPPLFNNGAHHIRRFIDPVTRELLEVHDSQNGYLVGIDELVVSRAERDRFEQIHTIPCDCEPDDGNACRTFPAANASTETPMKLVRKHFIERRTHGELLPSLAEEGEYLSNWAARNVSEGQVPKVKSIKNTIRADFREYEFERRTRIKQSKGSAPQKPTTSL